MFVAVDKDELVQRVVSLAKLIWEEHYPSIIGEEQVEYMLRNFQSPEAIRDQLEEGVEYFLITSGNEDIGYFAIQLDDEGVFLSKLYIKASESGSGWGSKTLDFIRDQWHAELVWLTVNRGNRDSIRFYQNRGFSIEGEVVKEIGGGFVMDDYRMEWRPGK